MIKVKVFDYEHEKDLEEAINAFLQKIEVRKFIDIKYHVAAMVETEEEEQIYCFTAMIIYET